MHYPAHRLTPLFALTAALTLCACGSQRENTPVAPRTGVVTVTKPPERGGEPIVRVRIQANTESVTFDGPTKLEVYPADQPDNKQRVSTPFTLARRGGQWSSSGRAPGGAGGGGTGVSPVNTFPTASVIIIQPIGPAPLKMGKAMYPGHVRLVPRAATPQAPDALNRFDLVNHVRLEEYLPGVVQKELLKGWEEPATYLAQAIVARTYAIDRIIVDGPGRHFDLEDGQASQAYAGVSTRPLATRAVADTVGLVLTYKARVIPAYYSSTCGGAPQSATDAFGIPTCPPLEPKEQCSWCAASRNFEWGTITRDRPDLAARLAAWGRRSNLPIAKLSAITSIRPSQSNSFGRPTQFEITDDKGQRFALRSESFRQACNSTESGPLPDGQRLASSAFDVKVVGDKVRFEHGRGLGHGVGMCQFGAQGMARSGYSALSILTFYYPGAKVERAY